VDAIALIREKKRFHVSITHFYPLHIDTSIEDHALSAPLLVLPFLGILWLKPPCDKW